MKRSHDDLIHKVADLLGVDEVKLRDFKNSKVTEEDIDKFGRLTELKASADISKAKTFFDTRDNTSYILPRVRQKLDVALRDFMINNRFDAFKQQI